MNEEDDRTSLERNRSMIGFYFGEIKFYRINQCESGVNDFLEFLS